jgi:hypothetical protein
VVKRLSYTGGHTIQVVANLNPRNTKTFEENKFFADFAKLSPGEISVNLVG